MLPSMFEVLQSRGAAGRVRPARRLLDGAYPRLPRPLDAASEGWSRLAPRMRALVTLVGVAVLMIAVAARIGRAEARWGGAPVPVLVATAALPVGTTELALRQADWPPVAVPPGAVTEVPERAVLALALPEGAVLTAGHLDPAGPAVGLPTGSRAVPVPVEHGWGVVTGGRVDVWVLGGDAEPARQVATGAPVLEVSDDGTSRTALIGLSEDEVGPTTEGLAVGSVLLTHAPP